MGDWKSASSSPALRPFNRFSPDDTSSSPPGRLVPIGVRCPRPSCRGRGRRTIARYHVMGRCGRRRSRWAPAPIIRAIDRQTASAHVAHFTAIDFLVALHWVVQRPGNLSTKGEAKKWGPGSLRGPALVAVVHPPGPPWRRYWDRSRGCQILFELGRATENSVGTTSSEAVLPEPALLFFRSDFATNQPYVSFRLRDWLIHREHSIVTSRPLPLTIAQRQAWPSQHPF